MIISEFSLFSDLCIKERHKRSTRNNLSSDLISQYDKLYNIYELEDLTERGFNKRIQLTSGTEFFIKGFKNQVKIYQK